VVCIIARAKKQDPGCSHPILGSAVGEVLTLRRIESSEN